MADAEELVNEAKGIKSQDLTKKLRENPWMVSTFVFLILSVILLVVSFSGGITGNVISSNDAQAKIISYLNSLTGGGVSLVSSKDIGNLYEIQVSYQAKTIPVYITKDGEYFVSSISQITGNAVNEQEQTQQATEVVEVDLGDAPVKGNKNAPVTILEFSDYQCPFCGRYFKETLPLIIKNYVDTGKVKLAFMDFPLDFHENAQKAAEAARCFREQKSDLGYWSYHDKLFGNQESLSEENYKKWAKELGADENKFVSCLDSGKYEKAVKDDMDYGQSIGVSGTPAFFVNGKFVSGAQPYSVFESIIREELNK